MASATANVHITVTGSGTPEPEVRGTEDRDMLQARVNELEERCAFQTEHIQMLRTRVKDLEEARCPAHDGQAASTTQASASAQTGQASGATGDDDCNVGLRGPAAAVGGAADHTEPEAPVLWVVSTGGTRQIAVHTRQFCRGRTHTMRPASFCKVCATCFKL